MEVSLRPSQQVGSIVSATVAEFEPALSGDKQVGVVSTVSDHYEIFLAIKDIQSARKWMESKL